MLAWRLSRQHLCPRAPSQQMLDVVGRICGLHAQLLSSAELSLAARVEELEPGELAHALWRKRRLVKTWAMRGTLHLLPADRFPLWQAAMSTFDHYLKPAWLRGFGVTRAELERLIAAVAQALRKGALTRAELIVAARRLTGSKSLAGKLADSWGAYLKPVAFRGGLCFAPPRGREVCFVHPDRWRRGRARPEDPGQAVIEVTRSYLGAYGPATREEYARWWGLRSLPEAERRIRRLGNDVVEIDVDGRRRWMLAAHLEAICGASPPQVVRLLPAFDPYVIAAPRDEASILPASVRSRVHRAQGWVSPVLLVNGRMQGVWNHEARGRRLAVEIQPFTRLPAWARRAAEAEADRLARFLGGELQLRFSS